MQNTLGLYDVKWTLDFRESGDSFLVPPSPIKETLVKAIEEVTGLTPELSTGGGISDGGYIKNICPVVEFGPINKTIHQIDEQVPVADLYALKKIYKTFILKYFNNSINV